MRAAAAVLCLALGACIPPESSATPTPTGTASTPPSPAARARVQTIDLGSGLVADAPPTWNRLPAGILNRATYRHATVGNGELASLPTIPGNGDFDAAVLPSGRVVVVVVAVQAFCGGLRCAGPTGETPLPLDWSAATSVSARSLPDGKRELALGFRWFEQPLFLVARWSEDAPPADVAAIAEIARSIRPDPAPPATGEYRGWAGLGPLASIPVGTVRLEPLPPGATVRSPYRAYDHGPFFLVRGKVGTYAFTSRPFVDQRCEIAYDPSSDRFTCVIGSRTFEWTRFGTYLGPEPQSNLKQHSVIVRDGLVWVHYTEDARLTPSVPDEAAER